MKNKHDQIEVMGKCFKSVGEGNCACGRWATLYEGAILFLCEDCLEVAVMEVEYGPFTSEM